MRIRKMLSIAQQGLNDLSDLPPIPQSFRTKSGQIVEAASSRWLLQPTRVGGRPSLFNWKLFEEAEKLYILSQRSLHLVKLYFIDCLARKETRTAHHEFGCFTSFYYWLRHQINTSGSSFNLKLFNWIDLEEKTIRAFLYSREQQVVSPNSDLTFLRLLYFWGKARRYPDFSPNLHSILKTMKVRYAPKGHNVRFRHPTKGPFSPDEVLMIREAIKKGQGTDQDRALVMLHLELGLNPFATAQLINKDLRQFRVDGKTYYQVDIPRIKKRIVHRETKRRPISNQLGEILEKLRCEDSEKPLFYWINLSWAHSQIALAMKHFVRDADIKSPHTGSLLNVSPRRFRYTLATHMAEEGASRYHIAEILDHSDLQNVKVYVETVSSIAEAVAHSTDLMLGPVVKRFLGKIIDLSVEQQIREGLPIESIPAMMPHLPLTVLNSGGVGMCGRDVRKDGLCRLFPPLSCYLCPHFAALRAGPHQEMLESIETFIHEIQDSVDSRIWKQLDTIRDAIKEVIEQLKPTTFQ